ncbi:hypothetical protein N7492_000893 [Penicillium capsulatum]|uniref:BZIP domain-containing protein n=1 Tax=Penicillium capsulatum TaxID=69766 RepID=A0A9W9M0K9_9EURO|nr:hypothetical protein N7492_000893 [Penicillium capsulatum]KAJ6130050.1 hypothetical protein N7512_002830 [Penicillium capsulatum]
MAMLIDSQNGNSPTPPTQVLPDPNSLWLSPLNLCQSDEDVLIGRLGEQRTRVGLDLDRGQNKSLSQSIPKPRRPSRAYISRDNVSSDRARHLERNRLAANKCRLKKKKENEQMQSILNDETARRQILFAEVNVLKEELWHLKNEVFAHANCDDQSINAQLALMRESVLGVSASALECPSPTFSVSTRSHSVAGIDSGIAEDESNIADYYSLEDLFDGFIDSANL